MIVARPIMDDVIALATPWIAVEVKRVGSGSALREGIGQALVYSVKYDFVVVLAIDVTPDGGLKSSMNAPLERSFLELLWERHNARFAIV